MIRIALARAAMIAAAVTILPLNTMAQTPAAISDNALPKDAATKLEQHNKQLHDQLGITAEQQPQWDRFTGVMRSNALDMRRALMDRGAKLDTMNAADNMQSFADMAKIHAANMEKAATAFQALYATLTPEQKSVADRVFRNRAEKPAAKKG
jgi:Spy/CpxP family protein refolding chaperone